MSNTLVEHENLEVENLSLRHIKSSLRWGYVYTERMANLAVACPLIVLKSGTATVNSHFMELFIVTMSNSGLSAWKSYHTMRIIICLHVHLPILSYQLMSRMSKKKMQCAVAFVRLDI